MVAAPNAPVKTPTRVMPIWTVARKRLGDSASSSARRAFASPSAALTRRRDLRAETTAISDMANTPFARMRSRMSAREIVNTAGRSREGWMRAHGGASRGGTGRAARWGIAWNVGCSSRRRLLHAERHQRVHARRAQGGDPARGERGGEDRVVAHAPCQVLVHGQRLGRRRGGRGRFEYEFEYEFGIQRNSLILPSSLN